MSGRTVSLVMLCAVAVVATGEHLRAQAPGRVTFEQKCSACHHIGGGVLVGPDLAGVGTRRNQAWLLRWITGPDKMIAAGDSTATALLKQFNGIQMPNLGLTQAEAQAVLAYIESASPAVAATAPVPAAPPPPAGDPLVGREYFTGTKRFANGGPPCMACHSVAGLGALGGGALGPNLTGALAKYGDAGLASILASPPFPTMRPIFSRAPLTPPEQAALRGFLQQAAIARRPAQAIGRLAVLAAVGAIVLLALAHAVWRRRFSGVRRDMVRRAAQPRSRQLLVKKES